MMSNTIKLSIPSLTYSQNVEEAKVATYSEQMRLLYVAMTRAVKKSVYDRFEESFKRERSSCY